MQYFFQTWPNHKYEYSNTALSLRVRLAMWSALHIPLVLSLEAGKEIAKDLPISNVFWKWLIFLLKSNKSFYL